MHCPGSLSNASGWVVGRNQLPDFSFFSKIIFLIFLFQTFGKIQKVRCVFFAQVAQRFFELADAMAAVRFLRRSGTAETQKIFERNT